MENRGGDGAATVAFLLATTGLPTPAVVLRLAGAALGADACPSQGSMAEDTLGDLTLATVLLANAGFVDAVGFLTLSDLFVSFASGNSTQLAIGIGGVFLSKAPRAGAVVGLDVAGVIAGRMLSIARDSFNDYLSNKYFRTLAVVTLLFLAAGVLVLAAATVAHGSTVVAAPRRMLRRRLAPSTEGEHWRILRRGVRGPADQSSRVVDSTLRAPGRRPC